MYALTNPRVYFVMTGILGSVWLVLLLAAIRSNYPRAIRGISEWATASFCIAVTGFVFASSATYAQDRIGLVARVVGNANSVLAVAYMYQSLCRFMGRPRGKTWQYAMLSATVLIFAFLGFTEPAFSSNQSVLVCSMLIVFSFVCAKSLWKIKFKKFPEYFLLSVFVLFALTVAVRLFLILLMNESLEIELHAISFWTAYLAVFACLQAAMTLGFMMLIGHRLGDTLGHLIVHGDFDPKGNDDRLELEQALTQAIQGNELMLYYQPRVDLASNRISALEALVRWKHPKYGMLSPAEFIPLSERTNAIVPLGIWALEQAKLALERLHTSVAEGMHISVNVSARQFADPSFLLRVQSVVDGRSFHPSQLEFELTESVVLEDAIRAANTMSELKQLGVRLAIDDFGTGYSSLSYLKRLPVDCVKIDASFVREIPGNRKDSAITRAVIVMGHELGLRVVAEGVEKHEQLKYLHDAGCDEFQGFLCSKAVPFDEICEILKRQNITNHWEGSAASA